MASVRLSNIHKDFGRVHAVQSLSLEITDGELLVLVGPSGSGKTTTLRLIAGLDSPDRGTIHIGNRPVTDLHPKDRDIAMVFQNAALYPHMRILENLTFALSLRKLPKTTINARVHEVARMLHITDLLDRKPHQLSGGQQQRAALGRAIVRNPKAFLFDEPLTNLDATLRRSTRIELKALLKKLATTTIYVTHDQAEAMSLGDRIAVMAQGTIWQVDTPEQVYRNPHNRFIASSLGVPQMNFVPGRLTMQHGQLAFQSQKNTFTLRVAPEHVAALSRTGHQSVVLGLRPHALHPVKNRNAAQTVSQKDALHAHIQALEMLGEHTDLTCTVGSDTLIVRTPNIPTLVCKTPITLDADMSSALYFEPGQFGRNLLLRQTPSTQQRPPARNPIEPSAQKIIP